MSFWQTLKVAMASLFRAKTRSLLTILGVIIGVGAVIAMVSIGEGAKQKVEDTWSAMGTDLLIVWGRASRHGGVRGGGGSGLSVTWEDLEAIRKELPSVADAAAQLNTRAQVVNEFGNVNTEITGADPSYFSVRNWAIAEGEAFNQEQAQTGKSVAVVGATVVENLFGDGGSPLGQVIRVKNMPFTIVGVMAKKGSSPWGSDYDDVVVIPAVTYQRKLVGGFNRYVAGRIYVKANDRTSTAQAETEIKALLRQRHRLVDGKDDDFRVRNMSEMVQAQEKSAETITQLLAGVALVSLLVGGIGIMNIMLVSVTERTREIGLRMAVGAKPRDVLSQFLVEAVFLSVIGGIIGTAAGIGAAYYLSAQFKFPWIVRTDSIFLAVGVSAFVGILFGMYPATRASRLDPITALRHE
jgi:putative ABC transport system permease protein